MISPELLNYIETIIGKIQHINPVSGGSINIAFCIAFAEGEFFIKINSAGQFPLMFQREQEGRSVIA